MRATLWHPMSTQNFGMYYVVTIVHEYNKQNVSELLKCLSLLKQISKWFKC